jgi:hypothetical protein
MKVKVNIRDYLGDMTGYGITVEARVDADDILEALDLPDEYEFDIDIHALLAERKQIAHIWGVEDVQEVRPDLDEDQAWEVLQRIDRRLDSERGISWETIEIVAEDLFGDAPETDDTEEEQS